MLTILLGIVYGAGLVIFGVLGFIALCHGMPLWQALWTSVCWPLALPVSWLYEKIKGPPE